MLDLLLQATGATDAERGEPGEERILRLELKLIADVALLECRNAESLLYCQ